MYKLIKSAYTNEINVIVKTEGNIKICIPFDPDNSDYQAYLAWVEQGNQPLPAEETV
jgi:hypothetical protein